jgi:allantoate deiminase
VKREKERIDSAGIIMQRLDILGEISDEPGRLTRQFGSPAMRRVNKVVGAWMQQAGMGVRQDAIGNLIGHYSPRQTSSFSAQAAQKILIVGSHLDTVRDAGKYDGPLGVLMGISCVQQLHEGKIALPFAIEVIGFADEEGLRYQLAYLGSSVVAGKFLSGRRSKPSAASLVLCPTRAWIRAV